MTELVAVRNVNGNRNSGVWIVPGWSSSGSTAPMVSTGPNALVNFSAGFQWYPWPDANPSIGQRSIDDQDRPDCWPIKFNDYLSRADRLTWNTSTWPSTVSTSLTTYSFRMYWFSEYSGGTRLYDEHLLSFNENTSGSPYTEGTRKFSVYLQKTTSLPSAFYGYNINATFQPYLADSTGAYITTSPVSPDPQYDTANAKQLADGKWWRIEVQVQPTAPKITVKFYPCARGNLNYTSTPTLTLTASPSDVAVNQFTIGKRTPGTATDGVLLQRWYQNLEFHNDYNLGGTAGTGYTPPSMSWYEVVSGSAVAVRDAGTVSKSGSIADGPVEYFKSEIALSASSYTKYENATGGWSPFYDAATRAERGLTVYVPNGTPPSGGWPLVLWAHGGFFSNADRRGALPDSFRNNLLSSGYAVGTVDYIVGTEAIGFILSKPAWPAQNSGMFPSFLIDFKMAARYLQRNYATNTAGQPYINPNKICASGYSAGGYIALGAATTKDLTINSVNTTLTNSTYANLSGTSTTWGDPTFKCAYVFAAPVDWAKIWNYDPTHSTFSSINCGVGNLRVTANTLLGRNYNTNASSAAASALPAGISINEFIAANAANCPPIGYVKGRGDYLVHWENAQALSTACAAAGVSYSEFTNNAFHDLVNEQFDLKHMTDFLSANGM